MNEKYKVPFIISLCALTLWYSLSIFIVLPMAMFITVGVVLYALTIFFAVKRAWKTVKSLPFFMGALMLPFFLRGIINNAEKNNMVIPRAVNTGMMIMALAEFVLLVGYLLFVILKYGDKKQTDKPEAKQESTEGEGEG